METFQRVMDGVRDVMIVASVVVGLLVVSFVAFCVNELRKDKRK